MFFDPVTSASSIDSDFSFNFKRTDFSRLNFLLLTCDWCRVLDELDIDAAVNSFYDILSSCVLQCVPVCRRNGSFSYHPWLDNSLKHLKNIKNKAWKRFCSSRSDEDFYFYSNLRDQYITGLEASYNDYITGVKATLRSEPRQFWSFVNSKRRTDGYPSLLKFGDDVGSDCQTIANLFGDFFRTAFLDNTCDINSKDFNHLTSFPPTSLEMKDLLVDDIKVVQHINNLEDSFTCGPDGVPPCLLKNCSRSLVPILCYLFNLSISSGVFPNAWKSSLIIPLHKKGDRCDISNYRPIAKLGCIAKMFEALLYNVISFHCKPFMGNFQHGFWKNRSTTTNLLEFSNFCISSIEDGKQVDCIFTDFSKAFDRINHDILIYKLSRLGFPSVFVSWIHSYLTSRTQRVLFRGSLSDEIRNTSGVPQGSHLGPLLFIIYINDVSLFVSNSRILCYADDAKIFRVVSSNRDCESLNSDLDTFYKWCSINHLPLNISKCTTVSFSRKRIPLHFDYTINGCTLTRLDKAKDLGVWLDSQLTFIDHIDAIVSKANSTLGFVKRWSKEFDDPYITRLLYCTFVRPILEYACCVWSPFYDVHINRIEAVQRRFVRFALRGLPWDNPFILPPYKDRLQLIELDSLELRRDSLRTVFAFDCLQGTIDSSVLLSCFNISVPVRSLRNYDFLKLPQNRTNYGFHEPVASMSRFFNRSYSIIDFNLKRNYIKSSLR